MGVGFFFYGFVIANDLLSFCVFACVCAYLY